MKFAKSWFPILASLRLLVGTVCFADQLGGAAVVPDLMLGILNNAKVSLEPRSLIDALAGHDEPLIRGLAADALGLLGEKSAEPILLRALNSDSERSVREAAALALARLGNPRGIAALEEFLRSAESQVRRLTIASQLAELGNVAGFNDVVAAANAKSTAVRQLAAQFLPPFISRPDLLDQASRTPAEILMALGLDEGAEVRLAVVRALPAAEAKGLRRERAMELVKRLADEDSDFRVRDAAVSLLEAWKFEDQESSKRKVGA